MVKDFGARSHAFQMANHDLLSLWRSLEDRPEFQVVYETWAKYLLIVYGSEVADEALFVRHTYLATVAKLMAWSRLTERGVSYDAEEISSVLEGSFFQRKGIENFLEEDFFSWITREEAREIGLEVARRLLSLLRNYNLRELSEDVFKSLYQELVDPSTRHDLGEYYTPDWLAHRMVRKLLDEKLEVSILDPACGSGTFLYLAIREKRERLGDSSETLKHILDSVVGADIHPLAVIVAKTNYILALGDLLRKRGGKLSIPIYLSDTIRLPEWRFTPRLISAEGEDEESFDVPSYVVELDGKKIRFPEDLVADPGLYDEAVEATRQFAENNEGEDVREEHFINYLRAHHQTLAEDAALRQALFQVALVLKAFMEAKRDSIWAFVLKNIYKPLSLKNRFDFVVGNPPWLSFRYAEPEYQKFLRSQIKDDYGLVSGGGKLITHLELATLFLVRAADLYLKPEGLIAFVLPRSIFAADQHDALRQKRFKRPSLSFEELWDLGGVKPLFNVPSCVLFARRSGKKEIAQPIAGRIFQGKLDGRNVSLDEAEGHLEAHEARFSLSTMGERSFWTTGKAVRTDKPSDYLEEFRQGGTIVPRSLWFVQFPSSSLGFDPSCPPVETAERAKEQAKGPYKGLVMEGNAESRFIYATLLSTDLLPFGHLDYRPVVLPIEPDGDKYRVIQADEASEKGYPHLARWLEEAQREWAKRRGKKAETLTAVERLDYHRGIAAQSPQTRYRVLYPTSATYLCASLVEQNPAKPIAFPAGPQEIRARGFLADTVTYCMEMDIREEALYVMAILNSPTIDEVIKPMQAGGLWGPRHIHKKPLEFPIPRFDDSKQDHRELAELAQNCSTQVAEWLQSGGPGETRSIGRIRSMVRELLREELKAIDELVEPMLGL